MSITINGKSLEALRQDYEHASDSGLPATDELAMIAALQECARRNAQKTNLMQIQTDLIQSLRAENTRLREAAGDLSHLSLAALIEYNITHGLVRVPVTAC